MSSKGTAIVTGSAQGIGRAIALRLADDGFDVAVNDVASKKDLLEELSKEIEEKGRKAIVAAADVSVESEVQAMVELTVKELGGLDVMVANAAIANTGDGTLQSILETTVDTWDRILAVNARSVFLCYKYAALQMISQGRGGRLIGASSKAGLEGEMFATAYSAAKFAIRGLSHCAAKEFGQHGITVNTYAPGAIDTPMLRQYGEEGAEMQRKLSSVGYNGTPPDIASIVSYLASKESHFMTGQTLSVDGGRYFS